MKIFSLNVNGLKASVGHGLLDVLRGVSADCICLQETKLQEGIKPFELPGYYSFWSYSTARKGYSGTVIFTKVKPISVRNGIGCQEFDSEGRSVTVEFNEFYLVNAYVPTSGDRAMHLGFRKRWDGCFQSYLEALSGIKPVIVCGDFNVAVSDIDVFSPETAKNCSGFLKEEKDGFATIQGLGLIDVWRSLHPSVQTFTWWPYSGFARAFNLGWRLDYFLCSKALFRYVTECEILNGIQVSDHCPVVLSLCFSKKLYS